MKNVVFILLGLSALISFTSAQTPATPRKSALLADSSQLYVQEIIISKVPVLIDFWAAWCRPCKMITPIITEIKKEYKGKIKVLKINIDRNRSLATYFRVVSIPSVFIVKDKIVVQNILGVQAKEVYIKAIQDALKTENAKPEENK